MLTCYGWTPSIGDPTFLGWVTVCVYFLTAILCLAVYRRCLQPSTQVADNNYFPATRWIWFGLFLAFVFLGVNKQLDLQTLLTAFGRNIARQQGWYAERLALTGAALVVVYVIIRASLFLHLDRFVDGRLLAIKMNWILELGGISLVFLGGLCRWKQMRPGGK
ncbi:MAG: hypothetical protein WBB19_00135 [Desulforhopalus sp.]